MPTPTRSSDRPASVSDAGATAYFSFIEALTRASGAAIARHFQHVDQPGAVEIKADASPVTIADREAEQAMRALIMAAYPDHGIIGEEYGAHQPDAAYQWVLDPIDGTLNFICGSFLFGTLIGLLHEGQPVLGALHHPMTGHLLLGDHHGAWLNGRPVKMRPCARIVDAVTCSTAHFEMAAYHDFAAYERLIGRSRLYRTWGDCHGYFLLATGGVDIMLDPVMQLWDVAALIPIVRGAGGVVTDWSGGDPLSGAGLVATAGAIHDEVIAILNGG